MSITNMLHLTHKEDEKMVWGPIMAQGLNLMKNERISGGALILLVCTLYFSFVWADERFAKVEDLKTLQETVEIGFESIAINDASAEIRDVKLSAQIAKATDAPEGDQDRIQEQLEHAVAYKQCLVERGTNCAHLREVE